MKDKILELINTDENRMKAVWLLESVRPVVDMGRDALDCIEQRIDVALDTVES